ncbi:MAG: FAD-dependent oxidoreductase [Bacteroidota bacterium]
MTRSEFIKVCSLLGIGFPLQASLSSCTDTNNNTPNTIEKVIIVGAGPAGLTAGYLLQQQGIPFQILEATTNYGGRTKTNNSFANFPIPLGAEWLHVERGIFDEVINDDTIQVDIATTPYDPDVDYGLYQGQEVGVGDIGFTIDQKFINSSWFDFFEQYVVPSVQQNILFEEIVETIDYTGDQVAITTQNDTYQADRVIVTVPVKLLQNDAINFLPALPENKRDAIKEVTVWDGFKAFIEFSEPFYPTFVAFDTVPESAGQKLYYDASYGQNTTQHILGLFTVGSEAQNYIQRSESDRIAYMLNELDAIFDGKASATYVKHLFQDWNAEPFAQGAYIFDDENWRRLATLGESVEGRVFFAGDAYTAGSDWSSVHAAARSAVRAVGELVG